MRRIRRLTIVAVFAFAAWPAAAQKAGGGGAANNGGLGTPGSTSRSPSNYPSNNPSNFPNSNSNSNPNSSNGTWGNTRPIFLSGRVLFDDGMKTNSDIRVERVCGGMARLEGHTDSKGQFSFQVGQNGTVDTDASDSISGGGFGRSGGNAGSGTSSVGGNGQGQTNGLWGCELRASYPGYRSDSLELGSHRSSDDPNVGTLILHRLGGASAGTISLTTALVPKPAQKDYEKGVQLAEKGKFEEAEKRFVSATTEYPKYAIAWFALGQIQQREGHAESAHKSYDAAIAADGKYASPYDQLALLSAQGQDWEAAANYSRQAIALDAVDYPSSLWYNALANYQLKKPAETEKSLRELLKLGGAHRYPQAEQIYAQLLLNKGDYAEAAAHLRAFVAIAPNAKDAAAAKELLAKLDQSKLNQAPTPEK